MENIEHPTSNIQHPNIPQAGSHWMFDVSRRHPGAPLGRII
jgi:hypothetical protein